jgi:polyhydroxyalkanoate synthesis regulator phasin
MENKMDRAMKVKYECELQFKNQRIRILEKELEDSKRLTADLMIKINSVEEQVKYAVKAVVSWCDECACKKPLPAVTNLVGKFITDRDAKNSDPEATTGRSTECVCETPTETESRQRDCAKLDEQETKRRVPGLVEDCARVTELLKEQAERLLHDETSLIHDIKRRFEEENERQVQKMRDMCDELTWYKKQLLASLCREDLMGKNIYYCCMKSDQPLISSSSSGGGGGGGNNSKI